MEWFILFVVVWLAAKYWQKFATPARHSIASTHTSHRKLPTITPEMIEPVGKPLTRQDAAKAYRNFYIDHFNPSNGYELELEVEHIQGFISDHIQALELDRDETHKRLKLAKLALHAETRDLDRADIDECYAYTYDNEPIEETIARRQARLDEQNKAIAGLKADVRPLLVEFLNEQIRNHGRA